MAEQKFNDLNEILEFLKNGENQGKISTNDFTKVLETMRAEIKGDKNERSKLDSVRQIYNAFEDIYKRFEDDKGKCIELCYWMTKICMELKKEYNNGWWLSTDKGINIGLWNLIATINSNDEDIGSKYKFILNSCLIDVYNSGNNKTKETESITKAHEMLLDSIEVKYLTKDYFEYMKDFIVKSAPSKESIDIIDKCFEYLKGKNDEQSQKMLLEIVDILEKKYSELGKEDNGLYCDKIFEICNNIFSNLSEHNYNKDIRNKIIYSYNKVISNVIFNNSDTNNTYNWKKANVDGIIDKYIELYKQDGYKSDINNYTLELYQNLIKDESSKSAENINSTIEIFNKIAKNFTLSKGIVDKTSELLGDNIDGIYKNKIQNILEGNSKNKSQEIEDVVVGLKKMITTLCCSDSLIVELENVDENVCCGPAKNIIKTLVNISKQFGDKDAVEKYKFDIELERFLNKHDINIGEEELFGKEGFKVNLDEEKIGKSNKVLYEELLFLENKNTNLKFLGEYYTKLYNDNQKNSKGDVYKKIGSAYSKLNDNNEDQEAAKKELLENYVELVRIRSEEGKNDAKNKLYALLACELYDRIQDDEGGLTDKIKEVKEYPEQNKITSKDIIVGEPLNLKLTDYVWCNVNVKKTKEKLEYILLNLKKGPENEEYIQDLNGEFDFLNYNYEAIENYVLDKENIGILDLLYEIALIYKDNKDFKKCEGICELILKYNPENKKVISLITQDKVIEKSDTHFKNVIYYNTLFKVNKDAENNENLKQKAFIAKLNYLINDYYTTSQELVNLIKSDCKESYNTAIVNYINFEELSGKYFESVDETNVLERIEGFSNFIKKLPNPNIELISNETLYNIRQAIKNDNIGYEGREKVIDFLEGLIKRTGDESKYKLLNNIINNFGDFDYKYMQKINAEFKGMVVDIHKKEDKEPDEFDYYEDEIGAGINDDYFKLADGTLKFEYEGSESFYIEDALLDLYRYANSESLNFDDENKEKNFFKLMYGFLDYFLTHFDDVNEDDDEIISKTTKTKVGRLLIKIMESENLIAKLKTINLKMTSQR